MKLALWIALLAAAPAARADDLLPGNGNDRIHGSLGAGGALLLTGEQGDRTRLDATVELTRGRIGGLLAWRAADRDRRGLVAAGFIYVAAAARPRLVLAFHADLGADLSATAPLAGGGLRTTLGIYGPLGVILDSGGYFVFDGISNSRLQLQSSLIAVVRW